MSCPQRGFGGMFRSLKQNFVKTQEHLAEVSLFRYLPEKTEPHFMYIPLSTLTLISLAHCSSIVRLLSQL
jgi:hypothetical protein